MTNLQPEQFFHGTTYPITDVVRPANDVDKNVSEYSMGDPGDMSEGDHAFVIRNHEGYAWHAANTFHPSLRRSRVYEVEPTQDMQPGPWNKEHPDFLWHHEEDDPDDYHVSPEDDDYPHVQALRERVEDLRKNHNQDEWASPTGFPVRRRIDIMPGRQGTFPDISWGRFSERPHDQHINHPLDEHIQYGHRNLGNALDVEHKARQDNEEFNKQRPNTREPRRTGSRLKAFMMGQPDPGPLADHPRLF